MCMLDLDRAGCIVRGPGVLMDDDDEQQVLTRDEKFSLCLCLSDARCVGRDEMLVLFPNYQARGEGPDAR